MRAIQRESLVSRQSIEKRTLLVTEQCSKMKFGGPVMYVWIGETAVGRGEAEEPLQVKMGCACRGKLCTPHMVLVSLLSRAGEVRECP